MTGRWPGVARQLVTFLVSPRKVTKRRRPQQPRIPEDQARRVGGKELAPLLLRCFNFCERGSNTFAADPPDTLDLRRVCKGRNVKTRTVMTGRFVCLSADAKPHCEALDPIATVAHRQTGVDFQPLSVPPEIEPAGRISGKGV